MRRKLFHILPLSSPLSHSPFIHIKMSVFMTFIVADILTTLIAVDVRAKKFPFLVEKSHFNNMRRSAADKKSTLR